MVTPNRVFLDTSVVNLIVDYGDAIFDGYYDVDSTNTRLTNDVYALYQLFIIGSRNPLKVFISPSTFNEVLATKDPEKKSRLLNYSTDLWYYFNEALKENVVLNNTQISLVEEYLQKHDFAHLPGAMDRRLIIEALYYKCDHFCTRDWKTMLKHRNKLKLLPIKLITPFEWWSSIAGD